MDKKRADMENAPIAKFIRCEAQVSKLCKDVEKLISISTQHGTRIRELFQSSTNSVSQVEFMAAITTTRFQQLNIVKSMKETAKTSEEEAAGVLEFDNETKESKDTKVLKQQITNLESEIFNSNFKYNIEIKKLEHELKVSRKEQTELRKQLNNVDNKLYSVIYNMKEAGVPEAVELVNTHTTLVEIVDSDVERSRANTMHIITDAEALDVDSSLHADSPKRNSEGELEEHSSISELMETVRNTLTPSAEYKHNSVGFADDAPHSPQHSSSEQASQKTPQIAADTRDDFRRSIYKRSPTMMQQAREEEYVHRGPVYKKKVDDPATAYVHRDSTDLGSNPKTPYFGAHYSGRPSSPPHPNQPQPYQTQTIAGLETPGAAARRTSNPALFAIGRSPSFRQTYNVNTNTGYNTASHPPIDFYYEQFMALRDLVLASLPNRDASPVVAAESTQGSQQMVLQSLSVPPTYDYLDTLVTADSLRQYQKAAASSKTDGTDETKEKGTVGLCSTVVNYLASQNIPVEKAEKEEDEGDSGDENDENIKPSAMDKTNLPTVPILLDCRVLNRQLYTNVYIVKDVRAIAQAVSLSSMFDAVNTYESAAYGKFKSNLMHSAFPTNKINADSQLSVAIQTDGNHPSSRDGKRSRKQSVVSQQPLFGSDPSSGIQTPEQIFAQQNAFSQALLSSVEEMERPAQSFSGGGHGKRGSMGGSNKPSKKGSVSGNNKILQALKVVNEQFNKDGVDPLVEHNEPVVVKATNEAIGAESEPVVITTSVAAVATVATATQKPNNRKRSVAENKKTSFLASHEDSSTLKENSFAAPPRKQSISIQQFDMKSFGAALSTCSGVSGVGPESIAASQPLQISTQKERVGSIISVPPLVASPPAHMSRKSSVNPQPPGSQPQPPMTFNSASFSLNQQYQSIELTPEHSASMHSENGAVFEEENTRAELAELFAKLSPKSGDKNTPRTVVIPSPKTDSRQMSDSPSLDSYSSILLPSELSMMAGYESSVNSLNPSPFHDNNYFAPISNNNHNNNHSNNHNNLQQNSMHSIDSNDEDDEDDRYHTSSVYTAATGQSSGGQTHSMEAILTEVMKIFDKKMDHQKAKTDRRFKALEGNSNGISAHVNKILNTMKQMNHAAKSQHEVAIKVDASVRKLSESVSGVEKRMQQETVAPLQNNITSCLEHIVQLEKSIADQDKQIEAMQLKLLSGAYKSAKPAGKKDMFLKTNLGSSSDFNIESTQAVSNVDLDFISNVQDVSLLADTFAAEQQLTVEKHAAREELGRSLLGEKQRKSLPDYDVEIVLHQLKEYASLYKNLVDSQTRLNRHPDVPSSVVAVSVSPSRLRGMAGDNASPTRPRTPTKTLTRREVVDIIESDAALIGGNIEIVRMKNDIAVLKRHFAGYVAGGTNTNPAANSKHFIEFPSDMPELSNAVTGSPTSRHPLESSNVTKGKKAAALKNKFKVPIAGILPVIPLTQQAHTDRLPRPIMSDSFNTVNLEGDEHDEEADARHGDAFFGEGAAVDTIVQTSGILTVGLDEGSVSAGNSVINVDIRRTPNRSTRGVDSAGSSGGVERSENYMSPPKTAEHNLRVQLQPQPHQPSAPVNVKNRSQVPLGIKGTPRVALTISAEALLEQRLMEGGNTASGSMTMPENLGPHVNMLAPTPPSVSNGNRKRNFVRSDGTSQQQQPSYLKETSTRQASSVDPHNRRSDLHTSAQGPVYMLTPNSMRVVAPNTALQANAAKNNAVWQTDFKKQNQLQPAPHSRNDNQIHEEDSYPDSREASDKYYQDYTQAIITGGGGGGGASRPGTYTPPSGATRGGRTGGR